MDSWIQLLLLFSIRSNRGCRSCPLTVPASPLGGLCDMAAVCRFPVTVTLLEMRITAVFATRHTHSHGLRLVWCQVPVDANVDWAAHAITTLCILWGRNVYGMFLGCVFFLLGVLSKHWRCFALSLLSGCEVFVTVATPTPSVMVRRAYEATRVRTRVWLVLLWMLTGQADNTQTEAG